MSGIDHGDAKRTDGHYGVAIMILQQERELVERALSLRGLSDRVQALEAQVARLTQLMSDHSERHTRYRRHIDKIIEQRTLAFPWLAAAIAEYHELCDLKVAELLEQKLQPALRSAERVRALAAEKREWHRKFRIVRNRCRYYERLFPWLADFVDTGIDDLVEQISGGEQPSEDAVERFLTAGERQTITDEVDRNQRALDRWLGSRRTRWECGRDYERYIGYRYWEQGYDVEYHGAIEGLYDLGRDLIAHRHDETHVVQCKFWRPETLIHEKHVFQLFGTTVEYWLKRTERMPAPDQLALFPALLVEENIRPVFITSGALSDEAREFAHRLRVLVEEGNAYDRSYPMIKCNVSRQTGEKIYHLPMDQQYDRVLVERERGEFYASTVREAVNKGFRRAFRWRGQQSPSSP